nr:hypothetical protein [Tanacetum cinerariifolium]
MCVLINWHIKLSGFYPCKKRHNLSNTLEDFIQGNNVSCCIAKNGASKAALRSAMIMHVGFVERIVDHLFLNLPSCMDDICGLALVNVGWVYKDVRGAFVGDLGFLSLLKRKSAFSIWYLCWITKCSDFLGLQLYTKTYVGCCQNSVWPFSGLSLDRLFAPAGRPNIRGYGFLLPNGPHQARGMNINYVYDRMQTLPSFKPLIQQLRQLHVG